MPITATTSKQALIDLINKDNGTTLQLADVDLAAPAVVDELTGWDEKNTTVGIGGKDQSKLPGSVIVTYTRPSVKQLLAVSNWKTPPIEATAAAIIAAVKTGIVEDGIKAVPLDEGSYTITAELLTDTDPEYQADYPWKVNVDFSKHYVLCDILNLFVGIGVAALDEVVTTTELSGFTSADIRPAPAE